MPDVPVYKPEVLPSGHGGGALIESSQVIRPIARAGYAAEEAGKVGDAIFNWSEKLLEEDKKTQRVLDTAKIESALRNEVDSLKSSFQTRRDYDAFLPDAEKAMEGLAPKYRALAGGDRLVESAVEAAIANNRTNLLSTVRDIKFVTMKEEGQAQWTQHFNQAVKDYAAAQTPEGKQGIRDMLELRGVMFQSSALISGKQLEDGLNQFDLHGQTETILSAINTNAAGAVKLLEDKNYLPDFPGVQRQQLLATAMDHAKVQDQQAERAKETSVYGQLYGLFRGDPDLMEKELTKPEFKEANKLTLQNSQAIDNAITDLRKTKVFAENAVERTYVTGMMNKTLTAAQVNSDMIANKIQPRTAFFWMDQLRLKRDEETDPKIFNKFDDRVTNNDPTLTQKELTQAPGLSMEHRDRLLNKFSAKREGLLNDAERQAKTIAEKYVIPSTINGVRLEAPSAPQRLQKIYMALDDFRNKLIAEGKPFDDKARGEYNTLVSNLIETHRLSIQQATREITVASSQTLAESQQNKENKFIVPRNAVEAKQLWGTRPDGTTKGPGWLGSLQMKDKSDMVATEVSVTTSVDGKEYLIPTLVPGLTEKEQKYILSGLNPTKNPGIMKKAVDHAMPLIQQGKSPFKEWGAEGAPAIQVPPATGAKTSTGVPIRKPGESIADYNTRLGR